MSGIKILLIDDEPTILEVIQLGLSMKGCHVETAASGHQALEILKENHFEVILIDLKMPKMSGMDLLRRIKELDIGSKVFILTGYISDDTFQEAIDEGAAGYIIKPSSADQIIAVIEEAFQSK